MNKNQYSSKILMFAMACMLFSCAKTTIDDTPWVNLIDGQTLKGWTQKGGKANYTLRDGSIVGSTVHNTPNSFLTTDKMYSDFILELDYKVDSTMNSGIQIRSNSIPTYRNGTVHGYQVEIDPSERAWSAGIYDESRRGWLNTLEDNPEAQKAFKQNDWNHYRIEAIGDTIKTWINKIPAAYLIDDKTASGFICLQVHSIHDDKEAGTEIIWKNVKIITDSISKYSKKSPLKPIITKNQLTIDEKKNGWKLLWDGKTTNGWRGAKLEEFPKTGWKIEDGELTVLASGGAESTAGGDIVTKDLYSDFELSVDFKQSANGNSGVFFRSSIEGTKIAGWQVEVAPPKHDTGGIYESYGRGWLIKPDAEKDEYLKFGEWNTMKIHVVGDTVTTWLNGEEMITLTDEKIGEANGKIALQIHDGGGIKVSWKNLNITEL